MKQLFILAILLVALVIPASVQAVTYDKSLVLENKNTSTWQPITGDGISGTLQYVSSAPTFQYLLTAEGLDPTTVYSLIYYANPDPGDHPGALIGSGTSSDGGLLTITNSINLGINLPTTPDANMITDYSLPPNNYATAHGAKIWLVPDNCYDSVSRQIVSWNMSKFLFETDMVNYTDTDLGGGTSIPATTTITETESIIGFTVSPGTPLNFGSVSVGSCSTTPVAMVLTNTGNVPIKVSITATSGFYTDCLQLRPDGGTWGSISGWTLATIPVGGHLDIELKVCPTAAYTGTVSGTLSFVASFAP